MSVYKRTLGNFIDQQFQVDREVAARMDKVYEKIVEISKKYSVKIVLFHDEAIIEGPPDKVRSISEVLLDAFMEEPWRRNQ